MESKLREQYRAMIEDIFSQHRIRPEELPNIDIYMDQLTTFMDDRLRVFTRNPDNDKVLTKTMINNYTKNELLPPPKKKKYSKEHLILLIFIFYLKNNFSIDDINELLEPLKNLMLNGDSNGYTMTDVYRESLVWSSDAEEHLRRELDRIFEKSSGTFADAEDEMRDELQRFSFLMMLSHEVQIRKSLMQKILDAYRKPESQKEMKPAKHKKKKA